MRSIRWEVGTAIALVIAATACSSGSGSGNGGTGTGTCNNEQLGIAQLAGEGNACAQCLQNSCDSELQGYLSGCSDFLSCACAAGGNPSAIQGCASKEQESAEETELGHGYFTQSLIEGLAGKAASQRDGLVYLTGLQSYVEERVRELSGDEQFPTLGKPTLIRSFPLAKP